MLPVVVGERRTLEHITPYTAVMVGVSLLLYPAGVVGWVYLLAAVLLGSILFSPWGAPVPSASLQSHVRGGLFRYFPLELSLRRPALLADLPTLAEAWTRSGVVLEFQCPNGWDFELDALGTYVSSRVDDTSDREIALSGTD